MNTRAALIGGAILLLAAAAGAGWAVRRGDAESAEAPPAAVAVPPEPGLPIPPVPPRIADGEEYERCLDTLAADPFGAARMAEASLAAGGGEGAVHCLALSSVAMGEPERGAAMLEQLAGASAAPEVARAAIYGQANQAWMIAGDRQHAYEAASRALSLSPADTDLLIDRAIAAAALDRYQDSESDLGRALAQDPARADAWVLRGTAFRHMGRLDRAQDSLERALGQNPDNAEALLERGILKQRRNDRAGARADWERAVELAPDSATADLAQQNLALLEAGPDRR